MPALRSVSNRKPITGIEGLTIHIEGLKELERAFRLADQTERKLLRQELKHAAEPVQRLAEGKALTAMKTPAPKRRNWSQMRIGQKHSIVYIAPKQRGFYTKRNYRRYSRPNLKTLLLDRAMIPALAQRKDEVEKQLERMLGTVGSRWERAA